MNTHVFQDEHTLAVSKASLLSGLRHTMVLDITIDQYDLWQGGELIQKAMPNLTADEREFLMTGITPEEWADMAEPEEPPCEGELKLAWHLNEVSKW